MIEVDNAFVAALREKISTLEIERDALQERLANVDRRIEVLAELLSEESEASNSLSEPRKRRGRPRKEAAKPELPSRTVIAPVVDPLWEEASKLQGTDPEVAKRLSTRKFSPVARPILDYGPGVHPGVGKPGTRRPSTPLHAQISVDEANLNKE